MGPTRGNRTAPRANSTINQTQRQSNRSSRINTTTGAPFLRLSPVASALTQHTPASTNALTADQIANLTGEEIWENLYKLSVREQKEMEEAHKIREEAHKIREEARKKREEAHQLCQNRCQFLHAVIENLQKENASLRAEKISVCRHNPTPHIISACDKCIRR